MNYKTNKNNNIFINKHYDNIYYQQNRIFWKKNRDDNNLCENILNRNFTINIYIESIASINIVIMEKNKIKVTKKVVE